MPIVFGALVHGLALLRPYWVGRHQRAVLPLAAAALAATCLTLFLQSSTADGPGRRSEFTAAADRLIAKIPDDATVSTTDTIAPHLTSRTDVYLLKGRTPDRVDPGAVRRSTTEAAPNRPGHPRRRPGPAAAPRAAGPGTTEVNAHTSPRSASWLPGRLTLLLAPAYAATPRGCARGVPGAMGLCAA